MEEIDKLFEETYKKIGDKIYSLELWCSMDIYLKINIKEYKGIKVYTSNLMPKSYALFGKLHF